MDEREDESRTTSDRWSGFTLTELLALRVQSKTLARELYGEVARRRAALEREEKRETKTRARAGDDVEHLRDARRQVEGSATAACVMPSSYASKDEVSRLRTAVRSLIAYLEDRS